MSKHPFLKIVAIVVAIVVGAIAGCAVVTSLREAGHEKSRHVEYDSAMSRAVENINQKLPAMLDSETRLDGMSATSGHMKYFLSLSSQVKAELSLPLLQEKLRQNAIANYRTNGVLDMERQNKVILDYHYTDKNGELLFEISVSPKDF
jgi:hypothetical protein